VALVTIGGQGHPIDGVTAVVDAIEGLQLQVVTVDQFNVGHREMQGLARNGQEFLAQLLDIVFDEDGSLVYGQPLPVSDVSPAAVVGYQTGHGFLARLGTQQDGAMQDGDVVGYVGHVFHIRFHGQGQADFITLFPVPFQVQVAGFQDGGVCSLTVDQYMKAAGFHPMRYPDAYAKPSLALGQGQCGAFFIRKGGFLLERQAFLLPIQSGRHKQVYIEGIACMGVDELSVFAVVFHATANTTPHTLIGS